LLEIVVYKCVSGITCWCLVMMRKWNTPEIVVLEC